jgi:hypothetical protein
MGFFVVIVVVIIIASIILKKRKLKKEVLNSAAYIEDIGILRTELGNAGYKLSDVTFDGHGGVINVYKEGEYQSLGKIEFAAGSMYMFPFESKLRMSNTGNKNGMKYMAVRCGHISMLISSTVKTRTNPPDIPEWLGICAKTFNTMYGYKGGFKDPDWIESYPECKEYLNVMFR